MFKPCRYEKRIPEVLVVRTSFAPPLPAFGGAFLLLVKLLPPFLIVFGVWVIASQVGFPFLTGLLEKEVPPPVSGEFWELEAYAPQGEVLSASPDEVGGALADDSEPARAILPLFHLSVPKLGIERAEVETNCTSPRPDERLGHYQGSALPGEAGNVFIYGHSVLPAFFDPKNYKTIFSTLDQLQPGDQTLVEYGGESFIYEVERLQVVKPEEVNPFAVPGLANGSAAYLTLMTCDPPGLKTNRLLVIAKLVE